MKAMKMTMAGLALGVGALASGPALAAVNGSVAATSDYMFRGLDLSDGAAVQGSVTWNNPSGFYLGGWASNANNVGGNEFDAYLGWSADLGNGVNIDLGGIYYLYTEDDEVSGNPNLDFPEIYIGASFAGLSAKVFYADQYFGDLSDVPGGGNQHAIHATLSYAFNIQEGLDLAVQVGYSDGDGVEALLGGSDDNYWDYSVTLTKNLSNGMAANFAVVDTNIDGSVLGTNFEDKPKFVVSFSKAFNL